MQDKVAIIGVGRTTFGEGARFVSGGRSAVAGDMTQLRGRPQAGRTKDAQLGPVHPLGGPRSVACVLVLGNR